MQKDSSGDYAKLLPSALDAYMKNDRIMSSRLLDVSKYVKVNEGKFGKDWPNCSSLLLCSRGMLELIEALLSGSGQCISTALEVFWEAERVANNSTDKESIENRIARGCSYLFGGLLQVFLRSYVKSGVNLTIGYKLIRDFEDDVLKYNGRNSELIRSLGLLILSLLNFFSLILPPTVTSIGDMLGMSVSKKKFYDYVNMCISEDGPYSIIARLIYVYYLINSKSFMFVKSDPQEAKLCRDLVNACMKKAPNSLAIRVMNASLCLGENNVIGSVATLTESVIETTLNLKEWSTMSLAVHFKLGIAQLCSMNLAGASDAFGKAALSVEHTQYWSYIPFMRCLEGISYLANISKDPRGFSKDLSEIREHALKTFSKTYVDRNLDNVPVLPGDLWGSRVGYDYALNLTKFSDDELSDFLFVKREPLVDILYCLATCLYFFEKIDANRGITNELLSVLHSLKTNAKAQMVLAECYRRKGNWAEAVNAFDDAIELAESNLQKTNTDKDNVLLFALIFQAAALCSAGDAATALEVLKDVDNVVTRITNATNSGILGNFVTNMTKGLGAPAVVVEAHLPTPGNIVNNRGNEFELIINFRRNGIKRLVDEMLNKQ